MIKIIAIIFVMLILLPFLAQLAMSLWLVVRFPFMKEEERKEAKALMPIVIGTILLTAIGVWLGMD